MMKNKKWNWYDCLIYRLTGLTPIERKEIWNNFWKGTRS